MFGLRLLVAFLGAAFQIDESWNQSVDLLEQGDLVMADRGFDIQDSMAAKHAKLFIPPKRKSGCFETMRIAKGRIHVERAIRHLKGWHCIFDQVLPLSIVSKRESSLHRVLFTY